MSYYADYEVVDMRQLLSEGATLQEVADIYGTSREYMRQIKHNLIRKGIGVDASAAEIPSYRKRRPHPIRAKRHAKERATRQKLARVREVQRLRLELNWTQRHVAEHLGMSQGTVHKYTHMVLL